MVITFQNNRKQRKRVLLFVKMPPPITGATLMNSYVVKSTLLQDQFDVNLICISYKKRIDNREKFTLGKFFKIITIHYNLVKKLVIFKPKLVYFQISPLGVAFLRDCTYIFWLKIFRKHIVYHLHGKGIKEASVSSIFKRRLYRWAFKGSSIICLSKLLADDISLVYSGVPYIVNNGIPKLTETFMRSNDNKAILNVLFLSNLLYSKGIIVFLDALSMLDENYRKKISVKIVGQEAELSATMLNEEIEKRNIHNFVCYVGPKYGEDKSKIYQDTDILIYPTLNDVWGLVILEAMQFSIPVIASKEGAIPEIIDDGFSGFIVEKNNPEQIVNKLKKLIDNPDLIKDLGCKAREKYLSNYTIGIFERNLFNLLVSTLSKNK